MLRIKYLFDFFFKCSKSCGGGSQKRTIKCLEVDRVNKVLRESKNCKYVERPLIIRHCNMEDCTGKLIKFLFLLLIFYFIILIGIEVSTLPFINDVQNDMISSCRDEFPNCNMVFKSNLCAYHYYNTNCCKSCRMISNELY